MSGKPISSKAHGNPHLLCAREPVRKAYPCWPFERDCQAGLSLTAADLESKVFTFQDPAEFTPCGAEPIFLN